MATSSVPFVTEEDYLRLDSEAIGEKFEYHGGVMYAMSGGTSRHSRIITNCIYLLVSALRRSHCRVFDSNLRIRIAAPANSPWPQTAYYTYPDASVVCGPVRHTPKRRDTIENPTALIEVLSPSTERHDRIFKLDQYRRIESLQAYLIIAQAEPRVYIHLRQPDGSWLLSDCIDPHGTFEVPPIGVTIAMGELYDGVDFIEPDDDEE